MREILEKYSQVVGCENVLEAEDAQRRHGSNVTALQRIIEGSVSPHTALEAQKVVRIANEYKKPLYPISCGKNWGYGSRIPVRDGAVILDLSRMNRIRNADQIGADGDHFAVIEPGVTQGQLHTFLEERGLPFVFNVTGAGRDTSILGNGLERGCGYLGMRPDDLSDLEVVLGSGECLTTGHRGLGGENGMYGYGYGLGPSLEGLFFQSNFGVVLSAAFRLVRRAEKAVTVLAKLRENTNFSHFMDGLGALRRREVIRTAFHVGSPNRLRVTLCPIVYEELVAAGAERDEETRRRAEDIVAGAALGGWTAVGGVSGEAAAVDAAVRTIHKELGEVAEVTIVDAHAGGTPPPEDTVPQAQGEEGVIQIALQKAIEPLLDISNGRPSDGALNSPLWAVGEPPLPAGNLELDETSAGILFCCPALPLDGNRAQEVKRIAQDVCDQHGLEPYMTFILANPCAAVLILNLVFRREDAAECARAHRCSARLLEAWRAQAIYPYRLGVQSMEQFVVEGDPYWETLLSLKKSLDPNAIIAPARYSLA